CRHMTTSAFSLVVKQLAEQAQPCIVRGQGEVCVAEHKVEREVFQDNQAVVVHQPVRQLVPEVPANVGNVFVQASNDLPLVLPVLTALQGTGQAALRPTQFVQRVPQPARVVDQCAIRERQQAQEAHVRTDSGQAIRFDRQGIRTVKLQV